MAEDLTLATGEHKTFQTGPWMGNLKVNEEEDGNTGQDTLVEFNVENENGITMDVSYIAAFTVPVSQWTWRLNRPAIIGASHFFKPCEGAAYTHEGDHANAELCREGPIVCCIGSDCPPSIKQKDFNGTAHDLYADDTLGGVFESGFRHKHQNATRAFLRLSELLDL
ncbi:hypothetical protein N0V82_004613 [Gnomoniopsis sp. IMI 355080]|nr:hypothetical protein N0V82_004613 [Gnomoniopsis sp. IMI 355080]